MNIFYFYICLLLFLYVYIILRFSPKLLEFPFVILQDIFHLSYVCHKKSIITKIKFHHSNVKDLNIYIYSIF